MGDFAIGAGGYSNNIPVGYPQDAGSSRGQVEGNLTRLRKQREEYEKQKNSSSNLPELNEKISGLDKRIENLEKRLEKMKAERSEKAEKADDGKCETCENRKYQDGSDDPGVSFKTAQKVGPEGAEAAVRGHEYEHVNREQAKASREDREVVSQTVRIKHGICPECGSSYVTGGETVTVTRAKTKTEIENDSMGLDGKDKDDSKKIGKDDDKSGNDGSKTGNTAGKVGKNAGKPAANAGKSANTTGKFANTAGKPVNNAGKSATTTGKPVNNAGKPANDTGKAQNNPDTPWITDLLNAAAKKYGGVDVTGKIPKVERGGIPGFEGIGKIKPASSAQQTKQTEKPEGYIKIGTRPDIRMSGVPDTKSKKDERFNVGLYDYAMNMGRILNIIA